MATSPIATLVAALVAVAVALWLNPHAVQTLQSLLHAPGVSPSSESVATPRDTLDYAALTQYSAARSEQSLRWGAYRSGLYHGIRSRTYPFSVSAGLLWGSTHEDVSQLRHECRQEDRLQKYGWLQHDGRHYGMQSMEDQFNRVELRTYYTRLAGEQGVNGWASRVDVLPLQPRDERLRKKHVETTKLSLFFYVDLTCGDESAKDSCREKLRGLIDVASEPEDRSCGDQGEERKTCATVSFTSHGVEDVSGSDLESAPFEFQVVAQLKTSAKVHKTEVRYAGVKDATVLNVKERLVSLATRASPQEDEEIVLDNLIDEEATLVVIQATVEFDARDGAIEEGDVVLDLVFHEGEPVAVEPATLRDLVTSNIAKNRQAFEAKFEETFHLQSLKGYNSSQVAFARAAFSNLIGGTGFFYGSSLVQYDPTDPSAIEESPRKPLFTAVPSRSFFPRGFVWDEGFHQLGISSFDEEITRDVLVHWLGLMEEDGYIAREQILGQTARRRVPREFLVQHVEHANPPTLLLTLEKLLKSWELKGVSDDPDNVAFVKLIFPFLERWYTWLMETQQGPVSEEEIATLRWRGRHSGDGKLIANTLASGLDDYPRASVPSDVEMHVDLVCWMVKASEILSTLGEKISLSEDKQARLESNKQRLLAALDQVHWSEEYQSFFDVGEHSDAGHVEQHVVVRCRNDQTGQTTDTTASYDQLKTSRETVCPLTHPTYLFPLGDGQGGLKLQPVFVADEQPTLRHVKHIGYVSLFPLLLQVLPPDSPKLEAVLRQLAHPQLLWSPFGLRSIATNDLFYEQENAQGDAPYWRGSIWINLNYLAVRALHHYGHTPGPYETMARELYTALRENLVNTIYREYQRTGYLWEQYSGNVHAGEQYGRGQRCHPFSGWTALVVNIMGEIY